MPDAYIYDAIRSPRGRGRPDGSLHEVTALRLSADTLNAIKARNGTAADDVEDVIWGNVTQVGEQGGLLARSAVLLSDLDQKVPVGEQAQKKALDHRLLADDRLTDALAEVEDVIARGHADLAPCRLHALSRSVA